MLDRLGNIRSLNAGLNLTLKSAQNDWKSQIAFRGIPLRGSPMSASTAGVPQSSTKSQYSTLYHSEIGSAEVGRKFD